MLSLYNIAIRLYAFGIWVASFFKPKAILWINGRKQLFQSLKDSGIHTANAVIWIHAASLGEFEQGRPIIEFLKKEYPNYKILLTFFSPSGYEIRKNYELADHVNYMPLDLAKNARQFIQLVKPKLAIFIKYELWYHHLTQLQKENIPTLLVSALFRKEQFFFKNYGQWFQKSLKGITHIFVQNEASKNILHQHNISNVSVAGDTRIDRVARIVDQKNVFPELQSFLKKHPVLICGSTWPADEKILQDTINNHPVDWRYIIAPHEIDEDRLKAIESTFTIPHIRYSQIQNKDLQDYRLLIIDNIGLLSSLYQYGKIAYIGGAFGKGLHNTLEPIAFGLPVIFGPHFQKFEEANWLVKNGGAFSINSNAGFQKSLKRLEDQPFYTSSSLKAYEYIQLNKGATQQIFSYIKKNNLL